MVFKNLCILFHWMKVASALEVLSQKFWVIPSCKKVAICVCVFSAIIRGTFEWFQAVRRLQYVYVYFQRLSEELYECQGGLPERLRRRWGHQRHLDAGARTSLQIHHHHLHIWNQGNYAHYLSLCHDVNPYAADGYNRPKHKNAKIFENHLNPVLLVFIG